MSLLFDAFPKEPVPGKDRPRRLSAGALRLAIALGLVALVIASLDMAARQSGNEAATIAGYDAQQQGDVR